jgi:hypothetical protein
MKNSIIFILFIGLLSASCTPLITTNLQQNSLIDGNSEKIKVIPINVEIPLDAEILGTVKIGDSGFTLTKNCGYQDVLNSAKIEAQKAGGNAIKIVEHIPPGKSTCHRITAKILRINDISKTPFLEGGVSADNTKHLILNIYCSPDTSDINYDLHLGDSVICKISNHLKATISIKKEGISTIWAKIDKRSEIQIDLRFGQTYYLRCGIINGEICEQPIIELVDEKTGTRAFDPFSSDN